MEVQEKQARDCGINILKKEKEKVGKLKRTENRWPESQMYFHI